MILFGRKEMPILGQPLSWKESDSVHLCRAQGPKAIFQTDSRGSSRKPIPVALAKKATAADRSLAGGRVNNHRI